MAQLTVKNTFLHFSVEDLYNDGPPDPVRTKTAPLSAQSALAPRSKFSLEEMPDMNHNLVFPCSTDAFLSMSSTGDFVAPKSQVSLSWSSPVKTKVKNTFVDIDDDDSPQPGVSRSQTTPSPKIGEDEDPASDNSRDDGKAVGFDLVARAGALALTTSSSTRIARDTKMVCVSDGTSYLHFSIEGKEFYSSSPSDRVSGTFHVPLREGEPPVCFHLGLRPSIDGEKQNGFRDSGGRGVLTLTCKDRLGAERLSSAEIHLEFNTRLDASGTGCMSGLELVTYRGRPHPHDFARKRALSILPCTASSDDHGKEWDFTKYVLRNQELEVVVRLRPLGAA